jgi:hypothetical protein
MRFAEDKDFRLLVGDFPVFGFVFGDRRGTGQIVDSIMALFRTDFSGRGELSERQQKVFAHSGRHNIVQFTDDPKARSGSNNNAHLQLHEY